MSEGGKQLLLARNVWEILELLELIKGGIVVMQTKISKMNGTGVKSRVKECNVLSLAIEKAVDNTGKKSFIKYNAEAQDSVKKDKERQNQFLNSSRGVEVATREFHS